MGTIDYDADAILAALQSGGAGALPTGTAGTPASATVTVQGITGGTPVPTSEQDGLVINGPQAVPVTISIATPAVVTMANTFVAGQPIKFDTTGALPTGITPDVVYYVIATGLSTTSYEFSATLGGAAINTSGVQSGSQTVSSVGISVASAAAIFAQDMTGYESISFQLINAGTSCTVAAETSEDGVNYQGVVFSQTNPAGVVAYLPTCNAAGVYKTGKFGRWFRLRVSAYGSGTVTVLASLHKAPFQTVMLTLGKIVNNGNPFSTGAISRIQSLATTNPVSAANFSTVLSGGQIGNNGAALAYLKLYNKASAPTVGTDVPVATIMLPIKTPVDLNIIGSIPFTTGLAYAITGGAADSDTTAVAADQVTGLLMHS